METIEFRVLGPLEAAREGRALELKRPKQRSLLAVLLLHAGEVVSTDRLVEDLWAGKPPKAAIGSLQNLVSELRKSLGTEAIETRSPGYRLAVDRERVDLYRFERLVAEAAGIQDPKTREALLQEGLALWRGPALSDLTFEAFANVAIARLEESRTAAREELIDAQLELGKHAQVVGELEALVAEHPLRERLRGQLMLALYRSGRQAEALDAYRDARETLVEELGIEPSAELQRLEQSILRQDESLDLAGPPAEVPRQEDRRKTVTILFTDIVDSTSLSAGLDPEIMRHVMGRYFDTVRTIMEHHGGTVEKFIGDAAMAIFGHPELHEDDALRAVRAASDLRDALTGLNADLQRDHEVAIQIRTAINTGEVIAGDTAEGHAFATGSAVNVAMKLEQSALPGETLIGATTLELVRHDTTTEEVEPLDLGGRLGRVQAFRLVAVAEGAGLRRPVRAPFVGRREELARLRDAFERAREEKRSQVLVVLGDAGIGKSRLAAELVATVGEDAATLIGRCVSYGEGATYLPIAEIVAEAIPGRLRPAIASLLAGQDDAELVAQRIGEMTGQAEGTASTGEVFWAVRRLFEGLARERPLLLVLEDLHWAEPTLLDLIEYLGAWISESPVLMVCLARPELLQERPGWSRATHTETISLEPLGEAETNELLSEIAGTSDLPDEIRSRIVEASEGNALFVEQLHAHVSDEGGPEGLEVVPASIEALLASRLDRLEPEERAVLERAAVVGKEFQRSAVLHLSPPEQLPALDGLLLALDRKGLVHAGRPSGLAEEPFRFHHVLIRDVTYAGLTKEARSDLHERFAGWLERRSEANELIGYHAEQAHRYRQELRPGDPDVPRLAAWAGERLASAGIRAWKRADTPAAVNLLGRAVALLPPTSTDRGELLCELGVAQRLAGDLELGEKTLIEAIESAASPNDIRIRLRAEIELAHLRLFSESDDSSQTLLALAEKAVPVFEELGDERALGRVWRHVGYVRGGIEGQIAEWQAATEHALVHYHRSGWSASGCLAELAAALFYGPTPVPAALERCEELLGEATDRAGRANVLSFRGGLEAMDDRFDDAVRSLDEAADTYKEIGDLYALANNSGRVLGRVEMLRGDPAAAEHAFRECCETFERVRDRPSLSTLAAKLADALYAQGRYDDASAWLDLAQRHAATRDVSAQHTWRRVRAKLLAQQGASAEAEALALEAERIAAQTDALNDHGGILLDLAAVLRLSGRAEEAAGQVEKALTLFERKGNVVSTRAARSLLTVA